MKKLFFAFSISLILASSSSSFAGIDYIQYREEFQKQESPQTPMQHKSSVQRNENSPTATPNRECSKSSSPRDQKTNDLKSSGKKCN